jgi:hypothetical protein
MSCQALTCLNKCKAKYCRMHVRCFVVEEFGRQVRKALTQRDIKIETIHSVPLAQRWRATLKSRAGLMRVVFYVESYAMYCKFDNPEMAAKVIGSVNLVSGKWNHHIPEDMRPDQAARYVVSQIFWACE